MTDTNKCKVTLWDISKQLLWKCELKKNHKGNHKATFNWIELENMPFESALNSSLTSGTTNTNRSWTIW